MNEFADMIFWGFRAVVGVLALLAIGAVALAIKSAFTTRRIKMSKQVMVCGVDCHEGDANCNGYCTGKADSPPEATEAQKLASAKNAAHRALDAAGKAWYAYAGLCDVGPERTQAFEVYERIHRARMA